MSRCVCCVCFVSRYRRKKMHRVPVLLKTARQFNCVVRRGDVVAIKSIKPGEKITVKPINSKLKREDKVFGKPLHSDSKDNSPIFDTTHDYNHAHSLLFSRYSRAFRPTNSA